MQLPAVPRPWALPLLWLLPAVWSSNYLIARAAPALVPPHVLAFGRWAIVCVLLLAFSAGTLRARPGRVRSEWKQLLVLGALGMWICGAWVYLGGRTTTATNIGLIYAAAPVGIAIGSQRLLGEQLSGLQKLAMAMACAGVVFVVAQGDLRVLRGVRFTAGDLWIVGATLAWIAYSLLLRAWPSALDATERLGATAAGGLVVIAPFAAWELWAGSVSIGLPGLGLIVLAGLLPGLFSYLAYALLQREVGAARAGIVMYLAPVYGALLAWWLLGETPQWYHLVGAALILPGIHFATRR